MSLQTDLKASLLKDAEAAIISKLGEDAIARYPLLSEIYAQRELDFILHQVRSLFILRQKKGVTWHQIADVHNRIEACDSGTRLEDAKRALEERKNELAQTTQALRSKALTDAKKVKLQKREEYRKERVEKAKLHLKTCQAKQEVVDDWTAKASKQSAKQAKGGTK